MHFPGGMIRFKATKEQAAGIEAYRKREKLSTESEAARQLTEKALKAEGLL